MSFKNLILNSILCFIALTSSAQSVLENADSLILHKAYAKAEEQLSAYLIQHKTNLKAKELLGDAYAYQEQWDKAIEVYANLTEKKPKDAQLHYKLGGAMGMKALSVNKIRALTYIGGIKSSLNKAIVLDSSHIDAHWALIEFYMALPGIVGGSSKKALKYAEHLEHVSEVDGYLAKGYIYEYDNEPELAEQHYLKAVEVGGSVVCYSELIEFYNETDQPQKAIATISEAQNKHSRNALHYQLGKVSADYNVQLDKGLQCLHLYIKHYSSKDGVPLEWAYLRIAQIYKYKAQKTEALEFLNKALELRQDFPQALKEREVILGL